MRVSSNEKYQPTLACCGTDESLYRTIIYFIMSDSTVSFHLMDAFADIYCMLFGLYSICAVKAVWPADA
jgi:hypothetical protein